MAMGKILNWVLGGIVVFTVMVAMPRFSDIGHEAAADPYDEDDYPRWKKNPEWW